MREYLFDDEKQFFAKLVEVKANTKHENIEVITPYPLHGLDEMLGPPSKEKFFTLAGALTGCLLGFVFTIYTVIAWPIITSGKPFVSIPPFVVIAFELTILLGGIFTLVGLIFLCRFPKLTKIFPDKEYGNKFVILVKGEES